MLNQDIQTVGRVRPGKTKVTTRLKHIEDSIEPQISAPIASVSLWNQKRSNNPRYHSH